MKLRLAILATLVLLLSVSNAFALMYGSPVSSLKAGHVSFGLGYGTQSFDIDDTDMQSHQNLGYIQLGLGLGGGWELYVRGGGSDMNLENPGLEDVRDSIKPFAGGGINGRLYDGQVLDIALFAQGNYYTFDPYEDKDSLVIYELDDFWDASGGIAFEVEIDKAFLYAGPYYYTWESTFIVNNVEFDFKPANQIGTMVGIRWPLVSGWELDIEGQLADKYVFGAQLNYPF